MGYEQKVVTPYILKQRGYVSREFYKFIGMKLFCIGTIAFLFYLVTGVQS